MSNPYIPNLAVIEEMRDEAPDVRTFRFRLIDREKQEGFSFIPGQFVEFLTMVRHRFLCLLHLWKKGFLN